MTIINRAGSKGMLLKYILPFFPLNKFNYCEPFGGSLSVLCALRDRINRAIVGDSDNDIANFWIHFNDIVPQIIGMSANQNLFEWAKEKHDDPKDRALAFYILSNWSYRGRYTTFAGYRPNEFRSLRADIQLALEMRELLGNSVVLHNDYKEIIKIADSQLKDCILYCDPPYYGTEYIYKQEFSHEELFSILNKREGYWILSYNDCPEIREMYKDYAIKTFSHKNQLNKTDLNELVICNES